MRENEWKFDHIFKVNIYETILNVFQKLPKIILNTNLFAYLYNKRKYFTLSSLSISNV